LLKLGERDLRPNPKIATDWLRAPRFDQARRLFEIWRDDPTLNELWYVPGLRCEDTGSWHNDPLAARQAALDYLALMHPGSWYSLDGLVDAVKADRPDFQRPGGDYDTWYIRDAQSGDYLQGYENWDKVDGALLRYLLTGPLGWLDVIQISSSRFQTSNFHVRRPALWAFTQSAQPQPSLALALTETGAALLGKGDPPPERGDGRFEVSSDGTVQVGDARRYERFQLSRVADVLRADSATSGRRTWIFQITPASLGRARRQRINVERLVKFLEESAGQPLPQVLGHALRRWEQQGVEAWGSQAVLLRVAQPELLDQLMNAPTTRHLIREPLSSTVAAVSPEHWPALQQALLEMGLLVESSSKIAPSNPPHFAWGKSGGTPPPL
jgi:hypothetical protein